jgi:redox-sensitive bicupin YhaK (pirin superfamily)
MRPTRIERAGSALQVVPASQFHRLTEREFGMPGLIAIESVGPFVELARIGPFITIHDSFMDPGLGIGHHPHRGNERLFYMLQGEIRHDDAQNDIQGVMEEGDLARLTEGQRGMLHKEWNGRDDLTTHVFILVYTPDVDPPIPIASFDAYRAAMIPRVAEAPGVTTLHVLGGEATFHANLSTLTSFFDSSLDPGAVLEIRQPPNEGLLIYPVDGAPRVEVVGHGETVLPASTEIRPEGPDAMAIAWSGEAGRTVRIAAGDAPGRVLRVGFQRAGADLVMGSRRSRPS